MRWWVGGPFLFCIETQVRTFGLSFFHHPLFFFFVDGDRMAPAMLCSLSIFTLHTHMHVRPRSRSVEVTRTLHTLIYLCEEKQRKSCLRLGSPKRQPSFPYNNVHQGFCDERRPFGFGHGRDFGEASSIFPLALCHSASYAFLNP